ncbi:MAG: nucleotidyltransferase domain-containing protein [Prolixibacteraceae bacterium]|nr:nucleotidyltransferase domain-containing protein [Prolixibacteraceae bacterium]
MVSTESILNYLSQNKERFFKEYNLVKIGIFGSFARNENKVDSDIDILVEFKEDTPFLYEKKISIKNDIQSKFGLSVDICREKYIKNIFKKQIISEVRYV